LGYVAGGIVLLKAAAEGVTLALQAWAAVLMGGPGDPLAPMYAIVGLGGLALLIAFPRSAGAAGPTKSEQHLHIHTNGIVRTPLGIG
jgi:hypothetical protein